MPDGFTIKDRDDVAVKEAAAAAAAFKVPGAANDATKLDRDPPAFEAAMKDVRDDKTEDDVRQGVTGMGVRYVLATSLAGALIALFILYAYYTPG